ncbi:MAG: DUF6356 family protein [Acidimicrobiales bacterium]
MSFGMTLRRQFTEHPASVGETYMEHLKVAGGFARTLAKATVACSVHAVVPSMCERTASSAICDLYRRMNEGKRGELAAADPDVSLAG